MRIYQPADGPDKLPQAMVEASTEYDWDELPEWLKESLRTAADALRHWSEMQDSPIPGELAEDARAIVP